MSRASFLLWNHGPPEAHHFRAAHQDRSCPTVAGAFAARSFCSVRSLAMLEISHFPRPALTRFQSQSRTAQFPSCSKNSGCLRLSPVHPPSPEVLDFIRTGGRIGRINLELRIGLDFLSRGVTGEHSRECPSEKR